MAKRKHFSQKQKLEILKTAQEIGIKEAARIAGVHYTSVYDWKNRVDSLGEKAFFEYQPSSIGRGIKKISTEKEKAVLETWERYAGFGPSQVRNQLRRQGICVSTRTVQNIMEANGYQVKRKNSEEKKNDNRFEATRPMELVQMDILEFFVHKLKVYLIMLLDDYSRFIVGWRLLSETSTDEVIAVVGESIQQYGKMEEVLSDRGFVFYSWRGINRFEKYLEVENIHHSHARAHHPQTLGKIEATNKQIQKELIRRKKFSGTGEARQEIGKWVKTFNYKRTHQGLGDCLVPADRFHGRVQEVMRHIQEGIDLESQTCYDIVGISRSLISLVMDPQLGIRLSILGKPITIMVGRENEQTENDETRGSYSG